MHAASPPPRLDIAPDNILPNSDVTLAKRLFSSFP